LSDYWSNYPPENEAAHNGKAAASQCDLFRCPRQLRGGATTVRGTYVPVEEPSTASNPDITREDKAKGRQVATVAFLGDLYGEVW
jgi:hypothetical protein